MFVATVVRLFDTSKLPASRRAPTARLLDEARQVEEKLTDSFFVSTLAANEAAAKATGGAEYRMELETKLQITAGKSSGKFNAICGILSDVDALHKECQKDQEEEKALIALLKRSLNCTGLFE